MEALDAIAAEWDALWQACHARPFQSPAWMLPWCRHVARGRIASLAVRDAATNALVALAPMYVYEERAAGRRLFPLGIATTDYLDVLVHPSWRDAALHALAGAMAARRRDWDIIEAPQLEGGSALLRCRWPAGWQRQILECEPHPVLPLRVAAPSDMGPRVAYARRRIARAGNVRYLCAGASEIGATLDALARLHASRWALRDEAGVLAGDGVLAWHREAAPQLHARGLLRLLRLELDAEVIAVLLCLADDARLGERRWYYYIGGFDPHFATLSPGHLLVAHAIDLARAEGATHFDFLRGAEAYKYRWGALDQAMFALRVSPSV